MKIYTHTRAVILVLIVVTVGGGIYYISHRPQQANSTAPVPFEKYMLNGSWNEYTFKDRFHPVPVKGKDNQIVYVSSSLNQSVALQLDYRNSSKSCKVPVITDFDSISDRTVVSLGNGKVVVSQRIGKNSRFNPALGALNAEWRVTIINPENCSYNNFTVGIASIKVLGILPYEKTFDVLIKNTDPHVATKINRYNDEGELVESLSSSVLNGRFKISTVNEYDASNGYYYVEPSSEKNIHSFKKLNSKFEPTKNFTFNHPLYSDIDSDAYSLEYGRFSVCHFNGVKRDGMTCLIVDDATNEILVNVTIALQPDVYDVIVKNLPEGGAVVVYSKMAEDRRQTVHLLHVSKDGKIGQSVELGKSSKSSPSLFFFAMNDASYCVVMAMDLSIMTKCLVPPKA